jgi:hypothetical protein
MAAPRRRATGPQQGTAPPAGHPLAVAQAFAMLARIHDTLTRLDENISALRAEVAALNLPDSRRPPPRPAARHAPAARLSCRGHQPRRTARQYPRPWRQQ